MTDPWFHQPGSTPPASDGPTEPREPMAWASQRNNTARGPIPGLKYPLGALIYGLVFIGLGILAVTFTASQGAVGSGIFIMCIAGALGIWMIVIAAVRWPWYRKYIQRHGHRPF